jgi:hypothetical protein
MMLHFFGFVAPAAAPEPEEQVIPEEAALLQALRTAYRNPAITTTKAMHLDVSARHPKWTVNLRRVRRLLPTVAAQHNEEEWVACGEDEVEDWCVIRVPAAGSKAASVSALWAARRAVVRDATPHPAPPGFACETSETFTASPRTASPSADTQRPHDPAFFASECSRPGARACSDTRGTTTNPLARVRR